MLNAPNLGIAPSASEIIAKHLREAIIAGHFAEDEPIRQDDIAQLFNVSKIPVREALKRLEAEGLVLFQRNKGAVVTRISEPELAQMFEVRVLLEAQAIRLAVPNMDETTFARAEAICADFVGEDNVGRWAELNWQLHACLYEPAQRPFLVNLIRSIHDKLERLPAHADEPVRRQAARRPGTPRDRRRLSRRRCRTGRGTDRGTYRRGLPDPLRTPAEPPGQHLSRAIPAMPLSSSA